MLWQRRRGRPGVGHVPYPVLAVLVHHLYLSMLLVIHTDDSQHHHGGQWWWMTLCRHSPNTSMVCHLADHAHVYEIDVGFLQIYWLEKELLEACSSVSFCMCFWSWVRPHTPRQHDVPKTCLGSLPREHSALYQQLSPWVPHQISILMVYLHESVFIHDP